MTTSAHYYLVSKAPNLLSILALTDERVLVGELEVEGDKVEEANESGTENRSVGHEPGGNEGVSSKLGLVENEADENDGSDY